MIATNQILVDGINQIIIDNDSHYFKKDLKQYQEKFITLKENGSILQHDFNDFTWIMKANHRDLGDVKSITFELSQYSDVNTAIKCLTIIFLEKGFTGSHVDVVIRLLQRAIKVSNCFAEDMVEEFEEFIFSQADFTKKRLVTIIQLFFNFYEFEHVIDDYIDILNMIPMPENNVRKIPDYKSIIRFDETIKSIILGENKHDIQLKYYPLFLWWIITGIIPMRASEFCELKYDCNFIDKERYWIKVSRNKVKQTSTDNQIVRVDVQETNKFIYSFIERYKSMLKSEHKSEYLISWKAYNYFCPNSFAISKLKTNSEVMKTSSIRNLFKDFYRENINDEKVIPLKPGDSRHIAFCNLMLQGHNPIAIARFGGHTRLQSQTHYYEHLDTYAESYVFAMAEKIQLSQMFKRSSGNWDANRRARVFSTYSPAEIKQFLEIEKGYCIIKTKGCKDFSVCEDSCWACSYHVIDLENRIDAQIELQQRSDKLGEVMREQIQLLKAISKSIFIDFETEKCSFNGNARLCSTAEQIGTTIAKKIEIDSKLLNFMMED